jgi:hypothetical protein
MRRRDWNRAGRISLRNLREGRRVGEPGERRKAGEQTDALGDRDAVFEDLEAEAARRTVSRVRLGAQAVHGTTPCGSAAYEWEQGEAAGPGENAQIARTGGEDSQGIIPLSRVKSNKLHVFTFPHCVREKWDWT